MHKKANSLLYIGGSLMLILAAIAVTTILNRTSNSADGVDVRAKAGVANTLQLTGIVASVSQSTGTLAVDNVMFASSTNNDNLGLWTVSSPLVDLSTFPVGSKITLTVDATTFLVTTHTMTATQIKITK